MNRMSCLWSPCRSIATDIITATHLDMRVSADKMALVELDSWMLELKSHIGNDIRQMCIRKGAGGRLKEEKTEDLEV